PRLPFGGCGPSGQGSYHGETGFRTFSHVAGIMKRSSKIDIALKYPPYGRLTPLIRKMLRL
ncbi:MAG: aldehyde dehydrogenase family protein, partial [Spirochaetales bacterium]